MAWQGRLRACVLKAVHNDTALGDTAMRHEPGPYVQVVVASKFDNRLKEFGERWEVDRYLSAAGYLSANVRPFFVALPKVSFLLSRCCPPHLYLLMLRWRNLH